MVRTGETPSLFFTAYDQFGRAKETKAEKGTGNVSIATNEHFMGAKSCRVESTSSTGRVGYEEDVNGTACKTYTMSAYI